MWYCTIYINIHNELYTVYIVHCTVYTVQWTMYTVYSSLCIFIYIVQYHIVHGYLFKTKQLYTLQIQRINYGFLLSLLGFKYVHCIIQCTLYTVHIYIISIYIVHCVMYIVYCTYIHYINIHCTLYIVQCILCTVHKYIISIFIVHRISVILHII